MSSNFGKTEPPTVPTELQALEHPPAPRPPKGGSRLLLPVAFVVAIVWLAVHFLRR